jgi:hypothetical protein
LALWNKGLQPFVGVANQAADRAETVDEDSCSRVAFGKRRDT